MISCAKLGNSASVMAFHRDRSSDRLAHLKLSSTELHHVKIFHGVTHDPQLPTFGACNLSGSPAGSCRPTISDIPDKPFLRDMGTRGKYWNARQWIGDKSVQKYVGPIQRHLLSVDFDRPKYSDASATVRRRARLLIEWLFALQRRRAYAARYETQAR